MKCAESQSPYWLHCWHWLGFAHKVREDGDTEYEAACCQRGRRGLAVPWPGEPNPCHTPREAGVGKAKFVAW